MWVIHRNQLLAVMILRILRDVRSDVLQKRTSLEINISTLPNHPKLSTSIPRELCLFSMLKAGFLPSDHLNCFDGSPYFLLKLETLTSPSEEGGSARKEVIPLWWRIAMFKVRGAWLDCKFNHPNERENSQVGQDSIDSVCRFVRHLLRELGWVD